MKMILATVLMFFTIVGEIHAGPGESPLIVCRGAVQSLSYDDQSPPWFSLDRDCPVDMRCGVNFDEFTDRVLKICKVGDHCQIVGKVAFLGAEHGGVAWTKIKSVRKLRNQSRE